MIESDKIADTAALLKEYFWPNGQWDDKPAPVDSPDVMISRRKAALEHLHKNVPESLENLFTKGKCKNGIDTLHDFCSAKYCSKIFYTRLLTCCFYNYLMTYLSWGYTKFKKSAESRWR